MLPVLKNADCNRKRKKSDIRASLNLTARYDASSGSPAVDDFADLVIDPFSTGFDDLGSTDGPALVEEELDSWPWILCSSLTQLSSVAQNEK